MALTAHQLTMRFGDRQLFEIERLSIAAGDTIWLHGANGVGKTTLLKILAGLLPPTRGYTNLPGRWQQRPPPHCRKGSAARRTMTTATPGCAMPA